MHLGSRKEDSASQGGHLPRLPLCGLCPPSGTNGHSTLEAPSLCDAHHVYGGRPGGTPGSRRRRSGGGSGLCLQLRPQPTAPHGYFESADLAGTAEASWLRSASAPSPLHPVAWTTRDHTASEQPSEPPHPHVAKPGSPQGPPQREATSTQPLAPEPPGADCCGPSRASSSPRGPHRILAPYLRLCLL